MPQLRQFDGVFLIHSFWGRLLLAILILVVDSLIFILPLGALFLAYVIIFRPPWFKEWIHRLYD